MIIFKIIVSLAEWIAYGCMFATVFCSILFWWWVNWICGLIYTCLWITIIAESERRES